MDRTVTYQHDGLTLVGDQHTPTNESVGTVILLHGIGQTRKSWNHTGASLAALGWTAIALDARGHGDSDWAAPGGYTLDALVDDLAHVTRTLDHTPVLVGASMGGLTALVAQARHRIGRTLVLVDIAARINPAGADRVRDFMGQHRDGFTTLDQAATALAAYNPRRRAVTHDGLRKNLRRHRDGRWYWHWDPRLLGLMADPAALTDLTRVLDDAAGHITVPTLLIRGERSDVIDQHSVDHLLDHIPTATSTTITDTGHMVVGDDNDTFTTALTDYLDRMATEHGE